MLTPTQYINANKDTVVENAFTHFLWYGQPYNTTIDLSAENARYNHITTYEHAYAVFTEYLHDVLENYNAFHSFLNRCRNATISPATRTAQQYVSIVWECDYTIQTVYQFLKQVREV